MFLRSFSKSLLRSNLALYESNVYNFGKIKKFVLPDLGEKIKDATIKKWHVKEGDFVEEYQTLVDVATDKLFTQIPSSDKGKIHKRCFGEEEACEVGQVLLEIEVEDGAETDAPAQPAQSGQTSTSATPAQTTQQPSAQTITTSSSQVLATPAVRALAREHKLDLSKIAGSGKAGRIMKEDVLGYLANPQGAKTQASSTSTTTTTTTTARKAGAVEALSKNVVKMTDFQKGMQKTMTEAASIPHFFYKDEFDITKLSDLRDKVKKSQNIKITFMPFIIKSISLALNHYPILNSWYDKEKPFEYNVVDNHNISFAIDSPKGLVVPNIKNVQNLSILEINEEFARIVASAQNGTLGLKDLTEGTFNISNIGNIGGTYLGPVVLAPQVSIVAIGKTQLLPRYIADEKGALNLLPRKIMNVSFGCDHRVLDGATVARFSSKWKEYMEDPETMLLNLK